MTERSHTGPAELAATKMSVSNEKRRQEMTDMLVLFLRDLGDESVRRTRFKTDEAGYTRFLPTTWIGLMEKGLLDREFDTFGSVRTYNMTTAGWLKALELSGQLRSTELRNRALKLVRFLKTSIDGRQDHYGAILDVRRIAAGAGLPEGWVSNALASGLLEELFPNDRMEIESQGHECYRVPATFGHHEVEL